MGWSHEEKISELKDSTSRLILIYCDNPTSSRDIAQGHMRKDTRDIAKMSSAERNASDLVAFACIRFELEWEEDVESAPVLYWCVCILIYQCAC